MFNILNATTKLERSSMRPKHYPYSGKTKTSTIEKVEVWENAYLDFIAENQKQQEKSNRKLKKAILRVSELESRVHQFVSTKH